MFQELVPPLRTAKTSVEAIDIVTSDNHYTPHVFDSFGLTMPVDNTSSSQVNNSSQPQHNVSNHSTLVQITQAQKQAMSIPEATYRDKAANMIQSMWDIHNGKKTVDQVLHANEMNPKEMLEAFATVGAQLSDLNLKQGLVSRLPCFVSDLIND